MSLTTCESCEKEFLTEADPYVVLPKPSGTSVMCLKCATSVAHRHADESAKDAYRRGWEQCQREAVKLYCNECGQGCPRDALCRDICGIASMEYKETTDDN